MKIEQSQIDLSASHASVERKTEQLDVRAWKDNPAAAVPALPPNTNTLSDLIHPGLQGLLTAPGQNRDLVQPGGSVEQWVKQMKFAIRGMDLAGEIQKQLNAPDGVHPKADAEITQAAELGPREKMELQILRRLLEKFFGRKIDVATPEDVATCPPSESCPQATEGQAGDPSAPRQGWGLAVDYRQERYESETMNFQASGVVQTADGREIDLQIDLSMSREFYESTEVHLRAGDALTDPLVINFDGTAAELGDEKLQLDIDLDGSVDQVAWVTPGSGMLALDRDGNGTVTDGSELFGPASGNGFAELAAHDEDGNGWIDEGDSVFDRLRVWTRDTEGQEKLLALGQTGVGAIYLGHVASPFAIKDDQNQLQAQVRATGLVLFESGLAGTVQQLDLAL
jgi:hypothetical protein